MLPVFYLLKTSAHIYLM